MVKRGFRVVGLLGSVCLLMVLFGGLFGVGSVYGVVPVPSVVYPDLEPNATHPYILEVPFGEYDYYVGKYVNGSAYVVNGSNWDRFDLDANASHIINQVTSLGNVSVHVLGDFDVDSSVVLENGTHLEVEGKLTAVAGCSGSVVSAVNKVGVVVEGVGGETTIDCGNVADVGVNFTNNAVPVGLSSFPSYVLRNVRVVDAQVWCFDINFYGSSSTTIWMSDCDGETDVAGAGAVNWYGVVDSRLDGGFYSNGDFVQFTCSFWECGWSDVHLDYINGHVQVRACNTLDFSVAFQDCDGSWAGLNLWNCDDSIFHDSSFRRLDDADTYDAILLNNTSGPASTGNVFSGLWFSDYFRYGVNEEDSTQDYNVYSGLYGRLCDSGVLRFLGVNGNFSCVLGTVVYS